MRTLIVIPARLASTRLPKKPLRHLGGQPLIVRVWERVSKMGLGDKCVVATDSGEVARVAREAGAECVMTSEACESGTARVAEVARHGEYRDFEMFVNVQGDEPFIARGSVEAAANLVATSKFSIGTAATHARRPILENKDVVKVVVADDGRAMYFSRAPIPFPRAHEQDLDDHTLQHVGVYAYTRAALEKWVTLPAHPLEGIEQLEQLRPLAAGVPIGVAVTKDPPGIGIDTEEDLERANAEWAERPPS
jgi:3-deoxy-D-manno-octulosonate cytidylyltransferase